MTKLALPHLQIPPPAPVTEDIPLTPGARLFVRPELNTIIHAVIGLERDMDTETIKATAKQSFLSKQPRFSCLLVSRGSREYWKRVELDIDRHIIAVDVPGPVEDVDRAVNDYIAELSASRPLSTDKPLWEIHALRNTSCLVIRLHHALGDGISLMAFLLSGCRKLSDPSAVSVAHSPRIKRGPTKEKISSQLCQAIKYVLLSLLFCLELIVRTLCLRDRRCLISGGKGVESLPRKIATAKFFVADMKVVKNAVPGATINDVLLGLVSSGLSRYLAHRSALKDRIRVTGVAMVNLRQQTGLRELTEMIKTDSQARWGNNFGTMLFPLHCSTNVSDPLEYVRKANTVAEAKKRSVEAHFSYAIGNLIMSILGSKAAYFVYNRIICHTTLTLSNVMGPEEEIAIGANRIRFLRVNTTSLPHALTMHMLSYAGRAEMQIMVAKDIIPDPEFLAKCFQDALLEMKHVALPTA